MNSNSLSIRENPWITACIPTYKSSAYLRFAVVSLLRQTYPFIRVVVISDGDDDACWAVLNDIRDIRLVRFKLQANRGPYFSLDIALRATCDDFFLIQDSDDWSAPTRVERLMRLLKIEKTQYAFSGIMQFRENQGRLKIEKPLAPDSSATYIGSGFINRIFHHGLYRRSSLLANGGYYGGFRLNYDTLITNIMLMTGNISRDPESLYWRRLRSDGLSQSLETGKNSSARIIARGQLAKIYSSLYEDYLQYKSRRITRAEFIHRVVAYTCEHKDEEDMAQIARAAQILRASIARQFSFTISPLNVEKHLPPVGRTRATLICPLCNVTSSAFLAFGHPPRLAAQCPTCLSLERHRLSWIFLVKCTNLLSPAPKTLLHVGPEPAVESRFRSFAHLTYMSIDLDPKRAMLKMDLTKLGFGSSCFDVIYCSHVLEHVPNDRRALSELHRVLKPRGWVIFMVPITASKTYEDRSIRTADGRKMAYGQSDHVRRYGLDFICRVEEAGFCVKRIRPSEFCTTDEIRYASLRDSDEIFLATK